MTEEEEAEALIGFPLLKLEREALSAVREGPVARPRGLGTTTIANLIQRKWIIRVDREENFGLDLYQITNEGTAALQLDQIAVEADYHRQKSHVTNRTYADLIARRRLFDRPC